MLTARSRRPTYVLNFPGGSTKTNFVYNRHVPDERESTSLPEGSSGDLDELPRYVRILLDIDNHAFNGTNINTVSSISPHIIGRAIFDPDGPECQLTPLGRIGQPLVDLEQFSNQIIDHSSYMSFYDSNIQATDFFLSKRLNLKCKMIASDYDIDLKSEEGINRALGDTGVLSDLSRESKDLFLSIKSSEIVPGITMVNDVSAIHAGDPLVVESSLNIPIRIDSFHGDSVIDDVFYTSPRGLMINDIYKNRLFAGETLNPIFTISTVRQPMADVIEAVLDGANGRRDETAEILVRPIVNLNQGFMGTVVVQNQQEKDGRRFNLFELGPLGLELINQQENPESPLNQRLDSGIKSATPTDAYSVLHVGYVVTRRTTDSSLSAADFVKKYYVNLTVQGSVDPKQNNTVRQGSVGMFPALSSTAEFLDTDVLYGVSYSYSCEPVFLITSQEQINRPENPTIVNHDEYLISSYLVSGVSRNLSYCKIIDDVAPPAPDNVFYRLHEDGLFIDWTPPRTSQNDIKYFQVFKRRTIDDPYTCIAMLDFDNSTVKTATPERVLGRNILKYPGVKSSYKDSSFKHGDKFMYAVCSVDAHGLTSGYSTQCEVSLDKDGRSPLRVRRVSRKDAPKQYPNFYIDPEMSPDVASNSITQDYMGTSGKKQVDIYFDPDVQFVTMPDYERGQRLDDDDPDARELVIPVYESIEIGSPDNAGDLADLFNDPPNIEDFEIQPCKYVFNFISIDRQKSDNLEIFLLNR